MHHFKAKGGTVFNFNSDLSGPVSVSADHFTVGHGATRFEIVSAADLLEFVEHVRANYGAGREPALIDQLADRVSELEEQVSMIRGHLVL